MTTTLLPPLDQLSGGRKRAQALVEPQAGRVRGTTAVLDCRQLVAGTSSFADELVRLVLIDHGANLLVVRHAEGRFVGFLTDAARDHGVSAKIRFD